MPTSPCKKPEAKKAEIVAAGGIVLRVWGRRQMIAKLARITPAPTNCWINVRGKFST